MSNRNNKDNNTNKKKPLLTVVEVLKGKKFITDAKKLMDPDLWLNLSSIKTKKFEKINPKEFFFEFDDIIKLDPNGIISRKYQGEGNIKIVEQGDQGSKGFLWELYINAKNPSVIVEARIRARKLKQNNDIKIGVFVQKLDFDEKLLDGFGRDGVLFAIRYNIRKVLQNAKNITL